eukprot:2563546-Prymnesium_polylepis.1
MNISKCSGVTGVRGSAYGLQPRRPKGAMCSATPFSKARRPEVVHGHDGAHHVDEPLGARLQLCVKLPQQRDGARQLVGRSGVCGAGGGVAGGVCGGRRGADRIGELLAGDPVLLVSLLVSLSLVFSVVFSLGPFSLSLIHISEPTRRS